MQRRSEEVGRVSKRNFETIGRRPWSQRQRNLQISKSDPEGNPHSKSTGVSHLSNVDPTERQTTLTRLSNDIVVRERDGQVSIIID